MTWMRRTLFPGKPLEAVAHFLLLALIFTLPLVYLPFTVESFILGKEVVFQLAVLGIAALLLIGAAFGSPVRLPLNLLSAGLAMLILWGALSVFWSHSPVLALEETYRTGFLILFLLVLQSILLKDRRAICAAAGALLISSFVLSVWVLIQDFRWAFAPDTMSVRMVLGDWRDALSQVGLGNTSHIGDLLAVGFLGTLTSAFLVRRKVSRILILFSLWTHAAALITVWSVHSNLSVIVGTGVMFWAMRRHWGERSLFRWKSLALAAVIGWVAVVGFFVIDHPLNPHGSDVWAPSAEAAYRQAGIPAPEGGFSGGIFAQAFASPRWTSGLDTRIAIWLTTLEAIRNNLIFGAGAGNFTYVYPASVSEIVANSPNLAPYGGSWTNAAHNTLLHFWSEYGLLGPILLLIIIGVSVKESTDRLERNLTQCNALILSGGLGALAAMAVQMQMNFPLQLPASSMVFLMLLALPFLLPEKGKESGGALDMPVERDYGPVILGVTMRNMAYPTELRLRVDEASKGAGALVAVASLLLAGTLAWLSLIPLRADMQYTEVRALRPMVNQGMNRQQFFDEVGDVLSIWPGHVDCRSAYQEALLGAGRFEDVVTQTPLVLEKLNAIEVYLRRALALESLGRSSEAESDWAEIFTRRPQLGRNYPRQFRRFLESSANDAGGLQL